MDANCVDPPVAMVAASPSQLTEALVLTLTAQGFDVHLPAGLIPGEMHPPDRSHLFPVPADPARSTGDIGAEALLDSVARTRRPLAVAVLDDGEATAGSLGASVRAVMKGWAGGHLLLIATTVSTSDRAARRAPLRARWHSVRHRAFMPAGRPRRGAAALHTSLTVLRLPPWPAVEPVAVAVAHRAGPPTTQSPLNALKVAQAGVLATRGAPGHAEAGVPLRQVV